MPRVTFIRDFECRLERDDTGANPRAIKSYPAGFSGSVPSWHAEKARKAGALAPETASETRQAETEQPDDRPER